MAPATLLLADHAVHGALLLAGLLGLAALLLLAGPRRAPRRPRARDVRERQLAQLRAAGAAPRPGTEPGTPEGSVSGAGPGPEDVSGTARAGGPEH